MNKFLTFILSVALIAFSTITFANILGEDTKTNGTETVKHTELNKQWTCTTNASSSDNEQDKTYDKEMGEMKKSAKDAFEFASKHCRDCTKITCEFHEE